MKTNVRALYGIEPVIAQEVQEYLLVRGLLALPVDEVESCIRFIKARNTLLYPKQGRHCSPQYMTKFAQEVQEQLRRDIKKCVGKRFDA